ncbi:hypothetical protein MASR1M12_38730 [Erysipelotrichia bacterium]
MPPVATAASWLRAFIKAAITQRGLRNAFLDNRDLDRFITSCGGDRQKWRWLSPFC